MRTWEDIKSEMDVVAKRMSKLEHLWYDQEVDGTIQYSYSDFPYYMADEHPSIIDDCTGLLEANELAIDRALQDCFCCAKNVMDDLIRGIIERRAMNKQIREFLKETDWVYAAADRDINYGY